MAQTVNILSINLSSSLAEAVVVAVSGNHLSVIESHSCDFTPNDINFFKRNPADNSENINNGSDVTSPASSLPPQLIKIIGDIKAPWRSVVVTIPPENGFSLNVSLPFGDPRQINKILPLEVQDLIPFEIDEYHLATSPFRPVNEDDVAVDVRVDLIEKEFLYGVVSSFQKAGIDPRIVSFPANTLATIIHIAPTYFNQNCALVWVNGNTCTVISVIDGMTRAARSINIPVDPSDSQPDNRATLREVRLFIGFIERRYNTSLNKIYILGRSFDSASLTEVLAREFEFLSSSDFLKNEHSPDNQSITPILAYQATLPTSKISSNFRSGEFQFRPQFKELMIGIRSLSRYITTFISLCFIGMLVTYFTNSSKISSIETAIRDRIKKTIPTFSAPPGQEISVIAQQTQQMEEQLKDLGSLATLSPLEAFLAISQDIPIQLGVSVNDLSIKETKISIKGTAPDYATLDKVEQALKAKRETYCAISIKDNASGSRGSNVGFELTLQLC